MNRLDIIEEALTTALEELKLIRAMQPPTPPTDTLIIKYRKRYENHRRQQIPRNKRNG